MSGWRVGLGRVYMSIRQSADLALRRADACQHGMIEKIRADKRDWTYLGPLAVIIRIASPAIQP